jgi:hypothetical protein
LDGFSRRTRTSIALKPITVDKPFNGATIVFRPARTIFRIGAENFNNVNLRTVDPEMDFVAVVVPDHFLRHGVSLVRF